LARLSIAKLLSARDHPTSARGSACCADRGRRARRNRILRGRQRQSGHRPANAHRRHRRREILGRCPDLYADMHIVNGTPA
jgi:hypothetical protein